MNCLQVLETCPLEHVVLELGAIREALAESVAAWPATAELDGDHVDRILARLAALEDEAAWFRAPRGDDTTRTAAPGGPGTEPGGPGDPIPSTEPHARTMVPTPGQGRPQAAHRSGVGTGPPRRRGRYTRSAIGRDTP